MVDAKDVSLLVDQSLIQDGFAPLMDHYPAHMERVRSIGGSSALSVDYGPPNHSQIVRKSDSMPRHSDQSLISHILRDFFILVQRLPQQVSVIIKT